MSFTAVCILDHQKNKTGIATEEEAVFYIYSNICEKCQKSISEINLENVFNTDCVSHFWWIEDDDDI